MEKRKKERRQDSNPDRRDEFTYLGIPGKDHLSLGNRRQVKRREHDQPNDEQDVDTAH